MARRKYATVKIPAELAEKLDSSSRDWGYRSRAEMVDDAVRQFIARMKRIEPAAAAPPPDEGADDGASSPGTVVGAKV